LNFLGINILRGSKITWLAAAAMVFSALSLLPLLAFAYLKAGDVEATAVRAMHTDNTISDIHRAATSMAALARLSAATGDRSWRIRYVVTREIYRSKLQQIALALPDTSSLDDARRTRIAHDALLAREDFAFQFAAAGRLDRAQAMVNDSFYEDQTIIHTETLRRYLKASEDALRLELAAAKVELLWTLLIGLVSLVINIVLWLGIVRAAGLQARRLQLAQEALKTAHGELAERAKRREASFFEDSPIAMFENDFSAIRSALNELRAEGVTDLGEWMQNHRQEVLALNATSFVLRINPAAMAMLEVDSVDVLREDMARFFRKEYGRAFMAYLMATWDGAHDFSVETAIYTSTGRRVEAMIYARPSRGSESDLSSVVCSVVDLTERKAIERDLDRARVDAEGANRAKSEFLAAMSHEIRTPLNGVLGMSHALGHTVLDRRQTDMVSIIRQSGESLLSILNDLLDLSKIEAGKMELEMTDFDISELLRGAQGLFSQKAAEKSLDFQISIAPDALGYYLSDPTRIRQILFNLISNAIKFTHQGSIGVLVRRQTLPDGSNQLIGEVRDTGIGLTAEQKGRLFQSFSQADASTTRQFGGTGLGLAICRKLCEQMDGEIDCTSEPGKGSTFVFKVRVDYWGQMEEQRAAHVPIDEERADPAENDGERPLKVLAAEDNISNRAVLSALLEPTGITLTFAENGREAVEAWKAGQFDLILMDVQMPEMDGPTATRIIREQERAECRPRTPIIALTANAMLHQVRDYLEAGMDDHCAKPIQPQKLFEAMMSALAASQPKASQNAA
jgi:two-component system, sensor histidine kinase